MMPQKPTPTIRVIPENAMLHFAVTQRQFTALLAAIKFFSQKLNDPRQREIAMSAFAAISTPTGFSLPSEEVEESLAGSADVKSTGSTTPVPRAVQAAPEGQKPLPVALPRGLAALGGRKK
jgi:hypothetical protein